MKTAWNTLLTAVGLFLAGAALAQQSPFSVTVAAVTNDPNSVTVTYRVPPGHYLYANQLGVAVDGTALRPLVLPLPRSHHDEILGGATDIYDSDAKFTYSLPAGRSLPLTVAVSFQGCSKSPALCFLPRTEKFLVSPHGASAAPAGVAGAAAQASGGFKISARAAGYLKPPAFVAFLDRAESGGEVEDGSLARTLRERGVWVAVLLILAAGLALNLTPCVLPMIPINLAIIGAGAQAGSRTRGLGLGAAYGAAIALVYGALGLAVVLAGVRFGALNASPWFNLAIAALFLTMALAMLGVINIDFSRFQSAGAPARRGGFATAFCMGAVAALLAGACVAPVVISVLLLAADLYARGARSGLLLPFVLGLGMALPWPFAGAGLSFLPRPGRWMEAVKIGFGVLILLFALWYGRQGFNLLWERRQTSSPRIEAARMEQIEQGGWLTSLSTAVDQATRTGRPVLIDFWASWCKNCLYMDKTTFQDPVVTNRLAGFVKVKVRAEDMQDPATRALLDRFGVIGLPTYVVLTALPAAP